MKECYLMLMFIGISLITYNINAQKVNPTRKSTTKQFSEQSRVKRAETKKVLSHQLGDQNKSDLSFKMVNSATDNLGYVIDEYDQYYKGIKVAYGRIKVISQNDFIKTISGKTFSNMDKENLSDLVLDINPKIHSNRALNVIKDKLKIKEFVWENDAWSKQEGINRKPEGELMILPKEISKDKSVHLVYKYDIYSTDPLYRADVFVDSQTGKIVFENNKLNYVDTPAYGITDYNSNREFTAKDLGNGTYELSQGATRGSGIIVYDRQGTFGQANTVTSNSTSFNNAPEAVQAYWSSEKTFDYFYNVHGRESYDNNGGLVRSYVNQGGPAYYSENAFWTGSSMIFGIGNGNTMTSFAALDIVAHEFTHGVTQNSANLIYSYESGALNESFSDIFGEMVENYALGDNNWLMGDDIFVAAGTGVRSLQNPNLYNHPDTYGGQHWFTLPVNYGGVHYNCGVQNFWFYLLSEGGTGINDNNDSYSVTAIGKSKAAAIAYRNLTVYLTPNSNYQDARIGAIEAARDLYGIGSVEEQAVTNAWYAVGVGPAYGQTGNNLTCVNGNLTLTVNFDNRPQDIVFVWLDVNGDVAAWTNLSNEPPNSTKVLNFTLPVGDYTIVAFDRNGDGFNPGGSYEFASSAGTIASGSVFNYTESVQFCVGASSGAILDTIRPTNPTNLCVTNISETSVTLNWNASTDNEGIDFYYILEDQNVFSYLDTTANTTYQVTNLDPNTNYSFRVLARDERVNISDETSNVVNITTLPSAPICSATTNLNLNIDFDANPEQVAWYIRDASNTIVANSGGQYVNQAPNTSVSESISGLPNGDYVLVMFDNDGTGTWNYSLTDGNNNTIINGVNFEYSQSYQFCIGASNGNVLDTIRPTAPLSVSVGNINSDANTFTSLAELSWGAPTDNVGLVDYVLILDDQIVGNFYYLNLPNPWTLPIFQPSTTYRLKMAVTDTTGNFSCVSNEVVFTTPDIITTLNEGYFETGWDNWVDGGNDCRRYNENNNNNPTNWSYEGARSVRLRDNSGVASSMTLPGLDLSNYNSVELDFYVYIRSFENVEDFFVLYNDGTNWINVGTFVNNSDFTNDTYNRVTVNLNASDYNFPNNAQFRIQCDASGNGDQIFIDQTIVTATTANNATSTQIQQVGVPSLNMFSPNIDEIEYDDTFNMESVKLYPNPASSHFSLNNPNGYKIDKVDIYDLKGKLVLSYNKSDRYDTSLLDSGIYLIKVRSEDESKILRLVKK